MALTTLFYDSATGLDTHSGAPAALVASGASATNGTGNNISLDGGASITTGMSVNDILWLNTAAGSRHLTRITAIVDGTTVTVEDALVLGAGVSWSVGGKRATLQADTTNVDIADGKAGWTFSLEGGAANQTYPVTVSNTIPAVGDVTNGPLAVVGTGATRPKITWTGNFDAFTGSSGMNFKLTGVDVENVTSASTAAQCFALPTAGLWSIDLVDCNLKSPSSCMAGTFGFISMVNVVCNTILTSTHTVSLNSPILSMSSCDISGGNHNVWLFPANNGQMSIVSTVMHDAQGGNLFTFISNNSILTMSNCVLDSAATGSNVVVANASSSSNLNKRFIFNNNIFSNASQYGVDRGAGGDSDINFMLDYNAFFNAGVADVRAVMKGTHTVSLTVDPYLDAAANDYRLNGIAGGGAACVDAGTGYNG